MKHSLLYRIILYILIAFFIINGWWYFAVPLLLIGVWLFYFKIELLIAGIMYDALFGMIPGTGLWGYSGTIISLILILILIILKKVVR